MANKKDAELLVDITKPILEDSDEVRKMKARNDVVVFFKICILNLQE